MWRAHQSHLFGGNNNVSNGRCNEETRQECSSEGNEAEPLCGHLLNSQLAKRSEGGNSFVVNSILERLGRPQVTKGNSDPIQTELMSLGSPKLFTQNDIKEFHEQRNDVKAPAHRLDDQEQIMTHSESGSEQMLLDPPITLSEIPTMELNKPSTEEVPACEFDKQQQEKTHLRLDTQLLLSEPPKPLKNLMIIDKEDNEGAAPEEEIDWHQQETTHLRSKARLEIPRLPRPMKRIELESDEGEAAASKVNVQQQHHWTQSNSELQFVLPECPELCRQMPSISLNEPDNGREAPANNTDDLQQTKTHSNLEAELETLKPPPKHLEAPNDEKQSFAHETEEQQQDETHTDLELQEVSVQEYESNICPFAAGCRSVLPTDVIPLSKTNPGKEGLATDESTPQINFSERKSVIDISSSGLDLQFKHSPNSRSNSKSSKKKAYVPTSASECFCSMPSYGYMVNCKGCGTHFHAACIQLEGMKPGESYTCATCNQQPNRKRRQVQLSNNKAEQSGRIL